MKDIKFYKLAVFVNALVPLALLAWDWARGQVGANPVDFVTRTTGTLTLVFLVLTLAVTPGSTVVVDELMAADHAQPGDGIGATVEARSSAHPFDEGLLRQLFGEVRIAPAASAQVSIGGRSLITPVFSFEPRSAVAENWPFVRPYTPLSSMM